MAVSRLPAHGNIVSYYRAWQQDKYMYIQMELCEGGSLAEQIQKASAVSSVIVSTPNSLQFIDLNILIAGLRFWQGTG